MTKILTNKGFCKINEDLRARGSSNEEQLLSPHLLLQKEDKAALHYFNPGHEAAILQGGAHFTHKKNVQTMQKDLEVLPLWYASDKDYVLVEDTETADFYHSFPPEWKSKATLITRQELREKAEDLHPLEATSWGLSPQSITHFQKLNKDIPRLNLQIPSWKEHYKTLASRETAAHCLDNIKELLINQGIDLPQTPHFCQSIEEVETYFLNTNTLPQLFKMPFSSSGRGLLWIRKLPLTREEWAWVKRAINGQGCVSIEPALDRIADYAFEFYSDGLGNIEYKGLSIFKTDKRGSYEGNYLQSSAEAEGLMRRKYGESYTLIKNAVANTLVRYYSTSYKGYLGIDFMAYRAQDNTIHLHPCIEINMRHTMGLLACKLSERFLHTSLKGEYKLSFFRKPGEALEEHRKLQQQYPTSKSKEGHLVGYLSLCPIKEQTLFMAYCIISVF